MKVLLAALALACLAGCSGPRVAHSGKTPAQAKADYDDCHAQAAMAAALTPPGKDYEAVRDKALDDCMKAIGYQVK